MQRQKTEEEIAQELSDEAFARQLQEQLNEAPPPQQQQQPQRPAQQHQRRTSERAVVCPHCQAVNQIPTSAIENGQQNFRCGSCTNMLPTLVAHQAAIPPPAPGMSHVTCQNCRSINQVPVGATTQFLCGDCHRLLTFNASPQQIRHDLTSSQLTAAHGYPAASSSSVAHEAAQPQQPPQIYEGRVAAKTIHVRCGQCQTVNTVKVTSNQQTVEFACIGCQSTNEVDL